MIIERVTESSSANKNTHTHRGYQKSFRYARDNYLHNPNHIVLDLFARECPWGDIRVDLNPYFQKHNFTNVTADALEYAKETQTNSIDIILLDPPYSERMAKDKYDEVGTSNLYTNPSYMSNLGKECFRILETGGYIIKAGYNSNLP